MKAIEINFNPETRVLRQFGWIALVAFGVLGGFILWRRGLFGLDFGAVTSPAAYALWGVGAVSAVLAVVAPRANRFLYVGLSLITYPIGYLLSYVLMGLLFYGMLTPVNAVFRLIGRDAMGRRFDRLADTYWTVRKPPASSQRYFRQF